MGSFCYGNSIILSMLGQVLHWLPECQRPDGSQLLATNNMKGVMGCARDYRGKAQRAPAAPANPNPHCVQWAQSLSGPVCSVHNEDAPLHCTLFCW